MSSSSVCDPLRTAVIPARVSFRKESGFAYVPHGNNRNAGYHKVEVRTTREGVTKTRQGYYTGPLVAPTKQ